LPDRESDLAARYAAVRALTEELVRPLTPEDQNVQSMPDASPAKWHLAHTTWFFERLVLSQLNDYEVFDPRYDALFNSYYLGLGQPFTRAQRGLLTRPDTTDILAYRRYVDMAMAAILADLDENLRDIIVLGLNHEQQHQELLLTDIKHAFSLNPLLPAYRKSPLTAVQNAAPAEWIRHDGGQVEIGHDGTGFAFDNEQPGHAVILRPFRLASRPVTCAEYLEFMAEGGYDRPEFWLSDGWALAQSENWRAPLYWQDGGEIFTLHGVRPLDPAEPVAHVSFYEAAAFAAWAGKRLPSEFEWEAVARTMPQTGNFLESDLLHPDAAKPGAHQMFGDVWEWTRSSYDPYPGYRPFEGPLSEYNGKFMIGQMVLRGGSCVTPAGHVRPTYRNFFPPAARWQFSGIRLAEDA
jgi:ergothioneine biosynthesis protein EgtB